MFNWRCGQLSSLGDSRSGGPFLQSGVFSCFAELSSSPKEAESIYVMLEGLIHQTASAAARNRDARREKKRSFARLSSGQYIIFVMESLSLSQSLFSSVLFEGRSVLRYCRRCLFCPETDKREAKIEGFLHNSLPGSQAAACCLGVYIAAKAKQQQQLDSGRKGCVPEIDEAFQSQGASGFV